MQRFMRELERQRWDDHRFYHHSRINQSLHFVSACSFLVAYVMLFFDPAMAAVIAWCISMVTRQSGHFFFEPRGFDHVNGVTDDYKEAIKVGYNIRRKVVLMGVWALSPALLWLSPSLGGLIEPATDFRGYVSDVGYGWLALGIAGVTLRVIQLTVQDSLFVGVVWATKIVTDPFHDIRLYWKSPFALLRGELIDPMSHASHARTVTAAVAEPIGDRPSELR